MNTEIQIGARVRVIAVGKYANLSYDGAMGIYKGLNSDGEHEIKIIEAPRALGSVGSQFPFGNNWKVEEVEFDTAENR